MERPYAKHPARSSLIHICCYHHWSMPLVGFPSVSNYPLQLCFITYDLSKFGIRVHPRSSLPFLASRTTSKSSPDQTPMRFESSYLSFTLVSESAQLSPSSSMTESEDFGPIAFILSSTASVLSWPSSPQISTSSTPPVLSKGWASVP